MWKGEQYGLQCKLAQFILEIAMAQVKDPVCGMMIEDRDAVGTSEYEGKKYYFCSKDCKVEFDENPEDYAAGTK